MSPHPDAGPELRLLATTLLALIVPALQAAAALTPPVDGAPGKCQQVWCPLCAVPAVASGDQHPLTAILADHVGVLLALLRAVAGAKEPGRDPGDDSAAADAPPPPTNAYEHIPITVYDQALQPDTPRPSS